jgi:beta-mannosidase
MSDPVTRPTSPRQLLLQTGWQVGRTTPERITDPGELADARIEWIETQVPSTVAAALQQSGQWHLDQHDYDLDAFDWWYRRCITEVEIRSAFSDDPASASASELQEVAPAIMLHCAGLATLVDVWLNGTHVLHSENMFRSYDCEVSDLLQPNNVLTIRFARAHAGKLP